MALFKIKIYFNTRTLWQTQTVWWAPAYCSVAPAHKNDVISPSNRTIRGEIVYIKSYILWIVSLFKSQMCFSN